MKIERCIQDWIKVSILAILDPQILSKNNEQKWVSFGYFLNANSFGHKSLVNNTSFYLNCYKTAIEKVDINTNKILSFQKVVIFFN